MLGHDSGHIIHSRILTAHAETKPGINLGGRKTKTATIVAEHWQASCQWHPEDLKAIASAYEDSREWGQLTFIEPPLHVVVT